MRTRRHGLAERRKTVGLSQERLAEAVGVDRSTVVRWERAATEPQPWHRPRLAAALKISVEDLAELLAPAPARQPPAPVLADHRAQDADDLDVVCSFRVADRQVGGAHLYAAVTSYLQRVVAPRVFGQTLDRDGERVFAAAASLTEMAGWMAHDCGLDRRALQHFDRASSMAAVGRDHQLAAHVFGSLSHLSHHLRRPKEAVSYAYRGQEQLALAERHPGLEARLFALRARGRVAMGDAEGCIADLRQAEQALAGTTAEARTASPWASSYDDASLAVDIARCLHQVGQHGAARAQAEQVIGLRPPDRVRSRAFAQLILVSILVSQHRLEDACWVARQVLDATTTLGSVQVFRQLHALDRRLTPYRDSREIDDFCQCLQAELDGRRWMTRQLAGGSDPDHSGPL